MVLAIVLGVIGAWLLASVLLALFLGRAVKLADRNHRSKVAFDATSAAAARSRARAVS